MRRFFLIFILTCVCVISQAQVNIITTIAGKSPYGYSGDGGPATNAQLKAPCRISPDQYGNIYIADALNHRIRKISKSDGIITTVAGKGTPGFSGDGGPATDAEFTVPQAVFVDKDQNIIIGDAINNRIRKVTASTGIITTIGTLKFSKGYSFGADVGLGFFFGQKRHFGLGTGVMFMEQHGVATLTNFHMDYRATDAAGNVFRLVLTGNDVREDVVSSMVNIPVVLKYKDRFSKHWGFAADAGALINVQMRNSYTTHATFDQGSIYKFVQNSDGGTTSVYDNAETPSAGDWLVTKAEFLRNNPNGNWQEYASIKRSMGINAGDVLLTGNRRGNNRFKTGSIGFIIQPSINYYLSDNVALNFGGYYMMQPFKNDAQRGYRLTDGNGSYSSVLNNVTASTNNAYGLNIGAKFLIGRTNKDRDHDGVLDKNDKCPDVFGLTQFDGCPDTDKDGIPDTKDSCPTVWGLALYYGCPDTDADGIPDKEDECPMLAGPKKLNGCPDRDNDGIADKNDQCPDSFGLVEFHGCPDTDGDGIPNNEDNCPLVAGPATNHGCPVIPDTNDGTIKGDMNTPILFEVNMTTIYSGSIPTIEDAVKELNKDKNATITIDGHADSSGPEPANRVLSLNRAKAVKSELTERGINPNRLITVGHGSRVPIATNSTYEGKEQNRRAKMKLHPSK